VKHRNIFSIGFAGASFPVGAITVLLALDPPSSPLLQGMAVMLIMTFLSAAPAANLGLFSFAQ